MLRVWFFNFSLCFALSAQAELHEILRTETDVKGDDVSFIYLDLDKNYDITQIMIKDIDIDPKTNLPYEDIDFYSLSQLEKGIVLKRSGELEVVSLKGIGIEPHQGGTIELTYLKNGIKKNYDSVQFSVERLGDNWQGVSPDGIPFNLMTFIIREFLGKKIGIKRIEFNTRK